MALNWHWDNKVGEAQIEQFGVEYTFSLYQGNAYLIFLYEWEDEGEKFYNLHLFFGDRQHMNNLLGLTKDHKWDNELDRDGERLKSITIYTDKYSYTRELVNALCKAFDELEIHLTQAPV